MKKRIIFVSLLTTILMLAFFSPALAIQPKIETFEFPDQIFYDCTEFGFNYTIRFDDIVTLRITTFYNEDDSVNRVQTHFQVVGTATNLETGTSFKDQASIQITFYPSGEFTERGVSFHLHFPGKGVVFLRVGKVVADENLNVTFVAGKNFDKFNQDAIKILCEGLAGL